MPTPPATTKETTLLKRTLTGLLCTLLTALLATLPLSGLAQQGAPFSEQPEVQAFIVEMHEQHGFDIAQLNSQFASIHSNATVLRLIRPPTRPGKQRSWERYLPRQAALLGTLPRALRQRPPRSGWSALLGRERCPPAARRSDLRRPCRNHRCHHRRRDRVRGKHRQLRRPRSARLAGFRLPAAGRILSQRAGKFPAPGPRKW